MLTLAFPPSFSQIASIPIGYNNPALARTASSPAMVSALINRPALGNFPSRDWAQILSTGLLRAAPQGLDQVFTAMAGSDANETAYKAAFMWRRAQERGSVDFTDAELSSVMLNQAPGSPNYSILSFSSGFHGRLFGSLSTTRSKAIHKLDIPAFDWPVAPFPKLRYPLEAHQAENEAEEHRCLRETEKIIDQFRNPVAAVVVEPIQSEGGDNHASPSFFRGLRELTKRKGVLMIVDEVQTGVGATGKFWAHEVRRQALASWHLTYELNIALGSLNPTGYGHLLQEGPSCRLLLWRCQSEAEQAIQAVQYLDGRPRAGADLPYHSGRN